MPKFLQLKLLFIFLSFISLVVGLGRVPWQSSLSMAEGDSETVTYFLSTEIAPIWSRPPDPPFSDFQEAFKLKAQRDYEGLEIKVGPNWVDWMILALFYFWLAIALVTLLYLLVRGGERDKLLFSVQAICVGMLAGAVASLLLWVFIGGWGPPALVVMVGVGMFMGMSIGNMMWQKSLINQPLPGSSALEDSNENKS